MAVAPSCQGSSHLDFSRQLTSCTCAGVSCGSNMYPAECFQMPPKTTSTKMHELTSHILCGEGGAAPSAKDQKDSVIGTILHTLTSIGDNLARLQTSFLSRTNDPLSVTIVNDKDITPELFGNSLETMKPLTSNKPYIFDASEEKPLNVIEKVHNFFDVRKSLIVEPSPMNRKKSLIYSFDGDNDDIVKIHRADNSVIAASLTQDNPHFTDVTCESNGTMKFHSPLHVPEIETSKTTMTNNSCSGMEIYPQECTDGVKVALDNETHSRNADNDSENAPADAESFFIVHNTDVPPKSVNSILEIPISARLSDICRKVWRDVTNRLSRRPQDSRYDWEMPVKRPYLPKQRRKANSVAIGRGRGRGRSQLRRSGVSQTRHRKKRIKHPSDIAVNVKDNYETWQDVDTSDSCTIQNDPPSDNCSSSDDYDMNEYDFPETAEFNEEEREYSSPIISRSPNVIFREEKLKTRNKKVEGEGTKHSNGMCIHDFSTDNDCYQLCNGGMYDARRNLSRSRLISESSADSEDSYCIVFEAESDASSATDEITDSDETSCNNDEDSKNDEKLVVQKVKFNLIPTIHTMIQWDYAYRAARRGPWEEMARDRERFKGRINCIAAVLNPILTAQHRLRVWQERFALQE